MQLFIASGKAQKDRKLMRKVDQDLVRRCFFVTPSYFLVFLIVVVLNNFYDDWPIFIGAIGLFLLSASIAQLILMIKFEQHYPRAPGRWRNKFLLSNLILIGSWCGFYVGTIAHYQKFDAAFLSSIYLVLLGAWSLIAFAAYTQLLKLFLSILLSAMFISIVFLSSIEDVLSISLLCLFFGFLLLESNRIYHAYWNRLESNFDLKRKTVDLETARREADNATQVKDEFLASMSHEIKTPLNSVLGMLSLLGDTQLSNVQKEFQSVAMRSGENLLNLINDILDYSQLTSQSLHLDSVVFDLRKMIEDIMDVVGPYAHEKALEISCSFDPHIPTRVVGDPARLTQVITNLATNAIKYSEHGEISVLVHLERDSHDTGVLKIEVLDEGIGLTDEQSDRIFDAFSRVDATSKRKHGGTGLGLAIAKGLIELMEGDVGVDSEPERGSNFWFTAKLGVSTQQQDYFQPEPDLIGAKVLIVMPQKMVARALSAELNNWSMVAEVVESKNQALQLLRGAADESQHYDFVIFNMGEDESDGFDLSLSIAEDDKLKDMGQIMLTTLVQRGSDKVFHYLDKIDHLVSITKPARRDELHNAFLSLKGILSADEYEKTQAQDETIEEGKVLLVEDNKVNQLVAVNMLKKLGYEVKIANNGREALGFLADHNFDLVLMDCQMPEMDGYETTEEIRRREKTLNQHIPIIAMTANTMEGDEARCLAIGMDDYLAKPVKIETLEDKLNNWIIHDDKQQYA